MPGRILILTVLAVFSAVLQPLAAAPASHPHEDIRQTVAAFVEAQLPDAAGLTVDVADLDRRLRLPACEAPLSAWWPPGARHQGNTSIGVRCESAVKPWKLFVQASIKLSERVAVLSRAVARGEVLQADAIEYEVRDVSRLRSNFISDATPLVGHRFLRSAPAGRIVDSRMLEAPLMVNKGQNVTITSSNPLLQVSMRGEALADGELGDLIPVKNLSSGRTVNGEIVRKGVVRIFH
ncbi:flagellar basal body P-ring formation chaperone FlgA [Granulosicoccaceae sp. 1_MG-2023]|nr:flagellar basal body P-ring formation chaperone FlgA [Granulosicoccaceae sp. 1_MG-2023]